MSGHLGTQHLDHYAGGLLSLTAHTGGNTNQTAGLQSEALCQRFFQRIDKFRNASNKSPAFIHAEPVRLCSCLHFDICAELIDLFSGHITAGNNDRFDCIAVSEMLEFGVFYQIRNILCSQVDAQVRLVASVCLQSIQILDPTERCGGSDIIFPILGKNRRQNIFQNGKDVFLTGKGHLHIQLIKFTWAAISAGIFIAEARRNLKIPVKSGCHQQLLELLRCLWECIELSRMFPGRDQIVSCSFRRGRGQNRCGDFKEVMLLHGFTNRRNHLAAQNDVLFDRWVAQIKITVLQSLSFISITAAVNFKRKLVVPAAPQNLD